MQHRNSYLSRLVQKGLKGPDEPCLGGGSHNYTGEECLHHWRNPNETQKSWFRLLSSRTKTVDQH
jgi:hypothetical protein